MRTATTLLIALLLFIGLPSCRTAKKVVAKEEASQELAASFEQSQQATTDAAINFDEAIAEQIRQQFNIIIDFKRWEYEAGEEDTTTDTGTGTDAAIIVEGTDREKKPPNARPKSYTEGTITIEAKGEKNKEAMTTADAQIKKTDEQQAAGSVEQSQETKTDTKTDKRTGLNFWDWLCIGIIGGVALYALFWAIKIFIKIHKAAKG